MPLSSSCYVRSFLSDGQWQLKNKHWGDYVHPRLLPATCPTRGLPWVLAALDSNILFIVLFMCIHFYIHTDTSSNSIDHDWTLLKMIKHPPCNCLRFWMTHFFAETSTSNRSAVSVYPDRVEGMILMYRLQVHEHDQQCRLQNPLSTINTSQT